MIPHEQEWKIYRGDDESLFFRVYRTASNGTKTYTPLDGTVKCQVRATRSPTAELIAELTATLGDQVAWPGSVLVTMTSAESAAMPNEAYYDVQHTTAAGKKHTYIGGKIVVPKDQVTAP